FFFLNYEGQRRAQSPTYPGVLVDNLAAINAVKASFGIAPEDLGVLKTSNYDNGFFRLDHQINDKNELSVHYFIEDARNMNMLVGETLDGGGIGAPSSGRDGLLRDQAMVATLTSQLSPSVVNSLLVQWARRHYGFPGVTGQPNLDIPNLLLFGHNFGAFDRTNESRLQISDSISWVKGSHLMKFGVDGDYVRNFVIWPGFTPARIIFPSLPDFLASSLPFNGSCPPPLVGLPPPCIVAFFWGAPIGPGPYNQNAPSPPIPTNWQNAFLPSQAQNFNVFLNHSYFAGFVQDQWKISHKLTLNYGLRYDFETGLGFYVNPDYKNFSPRVAIAYAPDDKTVIRAGYGIYYDKYNLTFFFVSGPQRPLEIPGLPTSKNMQTGTWLLNSMFLGPAPCTGSGCPPPPLGVVGPPTIDGAFTNFITQGVFPDNLSIFHGGSVVDRNSRTPYSEQASLEVDRQIGKTTVVSAGYLFVAGHKLVRPEDLNIAPPIGKLPDGKLLYNFSLVNSGGIFYYTDDSGNSVYHGLTLSVQERAGNYFHLSANYTLSKTLDDGTFTTFVSTPESLAQRGLERAYSNQDVRNRFVANFIADGPQHSFVRNFQLSSIVTLQSPRPFTEFVGFDANDDGNPVTDRVGQSARNTYRGDSYQSVDLRVSRMFFLRERLKLQLLMDVFNALNRPNVDEVFSVYGAPDFTATPPQHYKDGAPVPPGSAFGEPRTTFNPRQFQFAAKFIF
ncbi:MAG TPA: TonB-dependent receptor, partial [Blastocatellia bacterium]|nr:TonB-dependent receptor [Blastocatellia bacterium]